jgi:hypothetical protein
MLGDDMKRISIAVILMLVLAACGLPSGGDPSGGDYGDPSGGYYTVSGQIVRHDTGEPYPNADVRFGWLVNAVYEKETHVTTDERGSYAIQISAGQYEVTAHDPCDLSAGFAIVGGTPLIITVPGISRVDFVEYPVVPGGYVEGDPWCR